MFFVLIIWKYFIKKRVSGGHLTNDGRIVLCQFTEQQLLISSIDGSNVNTVQLIDKPLDICIISDAIVAVTYLIKNWIDLYNINGQYKLKSIPVPGWSWGLTTINNKLAVGGYDRIQIIDLQSGQVVDTIYTGYTQPDYVH